MSESLLVLIQKLADGDFHSGEELGQLLGISRAGIWKRLQQLESRGLTVLAVKGKGYRLTEPLDLLNPDRIERALTGQARSLLDCIQCFSVIESTNTYLLEQIGGGVAKSGRVCLAEQQTAGRGRRGRSWYSPFGQNLYLSVAWQFDQGITVLEGLSLAVGVAIVRTLQRFGLTQIGLKWPNDLLWRGRKIGGVLVEIAGDASGVCHAVVGVGLNLSMPRTAVSQIDQPWADLRQLGDCPDRNELVTELLNQLLPLLASYQLTGFAAYKSAWEQVNYHAGERVTLLTPSKTVEGIVLGVADNGGLRLSVEGCEQIFNGGEISLRAVS